MIPAMDNEKLKQLALYCTALATRHIYGHTCGDSVIEHAAALARELFPVRAKALVWEYYDHGEGIHSQKVLGLHYDIAPMRNNFLAHFGDGGCAQRVGARFDTIEGAKAACEQHHQTRFLEQMA